jgi:hypothetical protein
MPVDLPAASSGGARPDDPAIQSGVCYALFAYDVGLGIDLGAAAPFVPELSQRETVRHQRPTPHYFNFTNPPLRVVQQGEPIAIGAFATRPRIDLVLYDFGAVSVTYQLPIEGPLSALLSLSSDLYENDALLTDSRRRVTALVDAIAPAVNQPRLAGFVEDYALFHIEAIAGGHGPALAELIERHAHQLAQILRAETQPLSTDEVVDALASRLPYGPADDVILDWNGALLFQREIDDIRAVLEYANVELLELRWLDDQLDRVLDRSYDTLARRGGEGRWRRSFPLIPNREVRRIAQLQMDSALLFEGVSNALKLIGDQYLARLYRLAAQRLHLPEWDATILRKLQTAESIYQKLTDQATTRRLEVLEWIIIILIALSTVMYL